MRPPPFDGGGSMFSGWLYVCGCLRPESLRSRYFMKRLGEFYKISNYSAFVDKDKLISFWGQMAKGQI